MRISAIDNSITGGRRNVLLYKKLSASNGIAIGVVEDFGLDEFRLRLQGGFMRCVPVLIRNMRYIDR